MVAMLAKESKIPVVACCETYKFGDKIVLDAVTGNELGKFIAPEFYRGILMRCSCAGDASSMRMGKDDSLSSVHLLYDLTPPELVTAVCTEVSRRPMS